MDALIVLAVSVLVLGAFLCDTTCAENLCPEQLANMTSSRRTLLTYMLNDKRYDARVPPDYEKNVPTQVAISIHLLSFDSVSETRMEYSVEMFLTQEWQDERLHFANLTDSKWLEVDSKLMGNVWVPDVYFRNEKSASFHDITVPNKYMHLYPEGRVVYSARLSLTLNCRMNLIKYPLDTQTCPMMIQSYTYTTENVVFHWDKKRQPIKFDREMELDTELPQFSIVENRSASCGSSRLDTNSTESESESESESEYAERPPSNVTEPEFACIIAFFTLKRDIRYYIIQVYVPSILIVALSWVSFWLDVEAIPARVSLGVLTVLTLNTHGSTIQAALPKVSYIKAIDVWVVSSLIFVFAALLEFAYVNVLARRSDKEVALSQVLALDPTIEAQVHGASGPPRMVVKKVNGEMFRHIPVGGKKGSRAKARRVDKISRIVFPVSFVFFNLVYWIVYVKIDL